MTLIIIVVMMVAMLCIAIVNETAASGMVVNEMVLKKIFHRRPRIP